MIKPILHIVIAAGIALSAALPLAASAQEAAKPKKEPSAAQIALRDRQKACGAEWKADKAAGKIEPGMKWPKFWSACNTRMKAEKKS